MPEFLAPYACITVSRCRFIGVRIFAFGLSHTVRRGADICFRCRAVRCGNVLVESKSVRGGTGRQLAHDPPCTVRRTVLWKQSWSSKENTHRILCAIHNVFTVIHCARCLCFLCTKYWVISGTYEPFQALLPTELWALPIFTKYCHAMDNPCTLAYLVLHICEYRETIWYTYCPSSLPVHPVPNLQDAVTGSYPVTPRTPVYVLVTAKCAKERNDRAKNKRTPKGIM